MFQVALIASAGFNKRLFVILRPEQSAERSSQAIHEGPVCRAVPYSPRSSEFSASVSSDAHGPSGFGS